MILWYYLSDSSRLRLFTLAGRFPTHAARFFFTRSDKNRETEIFEK